MIDKINISSISYHPVSRLYRNFRSKENTLTVSFPGLGASFNVFLYLGKIYINGTCSSFENIIPQLLVYLQEGLYLSFKTNKYEFKNQNNTYIIDTTPATVLPPNGLNPMTNPSSTAGNGHIYISLSFVSITYKEILSNLLQDILLYL
ncbi:hypothetical protein WA158_002528 [Blastocystis sp. Blastoise]